MSNHFPIATINKKLKYLNFTHINKQVQHQKIQIFYSVIY